MDDVRDFLFGKLPTELFFLTLYRDVALLRPFREPRYQLWGDTFNLKTVSGPPRLIAELMQPFRQFIAIDRSTVVDRSEHIAGLQRLPTLLLRVPSGVEQYEMGVQLRVKSA